MHELTATRRLLRRFEPGNRCLILLYHRIGTPIADPWTLAVSPERFEQHLALLRERFQPLALSALVAAVRSGNLPARGVALTFDDGYADNLLGGAPLLEQYTIPATVYVTAGHLGAAYEFWWRQVEQLLLEPGELPRHLGIDHPALAWSCELGADATYPPERAELHRYWQLGKRSRPTPTARHEAFLSLLNAMEALDPSAREEILAGLFSAAGVERAARTSHRMLTADQVGELRAKDGMDVGAHTLSHRRLSALTPAEQDVEIRQSKTLLEDVLGTEVTTFAYPFGEPSDFDDTTVRLVRAAGYSSAGAVRDLAVSRSSRMYELPRVGILDWQGDEFEHRLEWWLRRGL